MQNRETQQINELELIDDHGSKYTIFEYQEGVQKRSLKWIKAGQSWFRLSDGTPAIAASFEKRPPHRLAAYFAQPVSERVDRRSDFFKDGDPGVACFLCQPASSDICMSGSRALSRPGSRLRYMDC
jgi:hypothetical protein